MDKRVVASGESPARQKAPRTAGSVFAVRTMRDGVRSKSSLGSWYDEFNQRSKHHRNFSLSGAITEAECGLEQKLGELRK